MTLMRMPGALVARRRVALYPAGMHGEAADAIQAARHQPIRAWHGPERVGVER